MILVGSKWRNRNMLLNAQWCAETSSSYRKRKENRNAKELKRELRSRRTGKGKTNAGVVPAQISRSAEAEIGTREIEAMGLGGYCSIVQFSKTLPYMWVV
jgi:hypothetical protein